MGKFSSFLGKYTLTLIIRNYRKFSSKGASVETGALGHGAVGSYPDRPFLRWRFQYKDGWDSGWRDNPVTYLQACKKLHKAFAEYASHAGISSRAVKFASTKKIIDKIIQLECAQERRILAWIEAIEKGELLEQQNNEALFIFRHAWEQQIVDFEDLDPSQLMIQK